ncbi:MAG: orotate phosphoribosyltransferase [Candidatus Kaiserbacteria bacterium]|nr:MAG: orotate phosphoribosyltransferase [Candidatus Kaiserbacteria bacterium]
MTEAEVLDLLQKVGAFRAGHFVFTSGRHSDSYILKDAMYAYPRETSQVCREMAERFKGEGVEAVIGPAIGAAILSQWTAYHMGEIEGRDVFSVYADKDGQGGFIIKRGYDKLIAGKKVLVVEDLTTTGGSVRKVVEAAQAAGAHVVGVVVLCNRGEVSKQAVGNPPRFETLVHLDLDSWPAEECDLCKGGIPVNTDVGHGAAFLSKQGK